MIQLMDASLLDATTLLALRLLSWSSVGIALAALAGVVLWEICWGLESRHHPD